MFVLSNRSGQCVAAVDICKVPTPVGPIPMPFPNIAMTAQARMSTVVKHVLVVGAPALNQGSRIGTSIGDEVGSMGGILSNRIKGQLSFSSGSTKVQIGGKPAVYLGSITLQNAMPVNAVGAVLTPSQTKVMVMG